MSPTWLKRTPTSSFGKGSGAGPIQVGEADDTRWPNVRGSLKLHLSGIVTLSANFVCQGSREKTGLFEFTAKNSDENGLVELSLYP
jgi:hypothetical protein